MFWIYEEKNNCIKGIALSHTRSDFLIAPWKWYGGGTGIEGASSEISERAHPHPNFGKSVKQQNFSSGLLWLRQCRYKNICIHLFPSSTSLHSLFTPVWITQGNHSNSICIFTAEKLLKYADGLHSWWATEQAMAAREQCPLLDLSPIHSSVYSKNGRRARNDNFLVPEQSQTSKASSESKVSKGVTESKAPHWDYSSTSFHRTFLHSSENSIPTR